MWLDAVDLVLKRLQDEKVPFHRIKGISGAGQQHGSVYWSAKAEQLLKGLDKEKGVKEQLVGSKELGSTDGKSKEAGDGAFSWPYSPNWQDASTQQQCDDFESVVGGPDDLAKITGSRAHHRFTGPQIRRFQKNNPEAYNATSRISLVSSFLASLFLGRVAELDISDVCGMNIWDIKKGVLNEELLAAAAGSKDSKAIEDLKKKLGAIPEDGGGSMGPISKYYVERYGFSENCQIAPFTGDNPSTILALPLRPLDAMVSLGTSTTFLMSTPQYVPDKSYHFFNHPTTSGLYMFMLCYKNGGLAREKVRDALNAQAGGKAHGGDWDIFNKVATETKPLGRKEEGDKAKLGLYFPLTETVPNAGPGTWRYEFLTAKKDSLTEVGEKDWKLPEDDTRTIVESQILSLRLRSQNLVHSENHLPPQPRRIYLVGGGSLNPAIAEIIGDVLGGSEGVWKLDIGGNACALGAAYKAVWAIERQPAGSGRDKEETFEELIGARWKEEGKIEKVGDGYKKGVFENYGKVIEAFESMENAVLAAESQSK
jgi:xylulokinase